MAGPAPQSQFQPRPRPQPARVWVVPNLRTPGLAAVVVAMWYAGASQGNGAAYLLCFVLTALALVSAVHAWTNLRGIDITAESIRPAFAGEELAVPIVASSAQRRPHFGLRLLALRGKHPAAIASLEPGRPQRVELRLPASHRGCFRELTVRISSSYPLGFFTARLQRIVRQVHYVYPAPHGPMPLPRALAPTRQPHSGTRVEGDDYGGVRPWQQGESQRHIDWKAAARGQPLLTKQWTGEADEILWLDWQTLPSPDTEARLSQLARWVVLAQRSPAAYELRLPGRTIPAARGDTHYHACLRALAEFTDSPPSSAA